MNTSKKDQLIIDRRFRLHELMVALISQQKSLELLDGESISAQVGSSSNAIADSARWLDRNQRVLKKYQALVRTAVTLDALLEAEVGK